MKNLITIVVNYSMLESNYQLRRKHSVRYLISQLNIRILRICLKLLRNSLIIKQLANPSIDKRIFSTGFNSGSG
jgi:hypothetical protein